VSSRACRLTQLCLTFYFRTPSKQTISVTVSHWPSNSAARHIAGPYSTLTGKVQFLSGPDRLDHCSVYSDRDTSTSRADVVILLSIHTKHAVISNRQSTLHGETDENRKHSAIPTVEHGPTSIVCQYVPRLQDKCIFFSHGDACRVQINSISHNSVTTDSQQVATVT